MARCESQSGARCESQSESQSGARCESQSGAQNYSQYALPLDWSSAGTDDARLIIGSSNAEAVQYLSNVEAWPVRIVALIGPPKSGRSLIGRLFVQATGGHVIDGPGSVSEETLFHAWNMAQSGGLPLLIIADSVPGEWRVGLADLRSRLESIPVLHVREPDDAMVCALIEGQFALRGIALGPGVAAFVAERIHRSYAVVMRCVEELDRASVAQGRRIGKKLANEILAAANLT